MKLAFIGMVMEDRRAQGAGRREQGTGHRAHSLIVATRHYASMPCKRGERFPFDRTSSMDSGTFNHVLVFTDSFVIESNSTKLV